MSKNYNAFSTSFSAHYATYFAKHYATHFFVMLYVMIYGALLRGFGIPAPSFTNMTPEPNIAATAVDVIVAFILSLIAALIGVNLIGPVATAVGGALNNKNLTGAANSLTAQITLIFVTVIILGIVVFLALFGKLAGKQAE